MRPPPTLQDTARRFGVKQYVAIVRTRRGRRFTVFTCGDERYYVFTLMASPAPGDTVMTEVSFPVLRQNLRTDLRRALAHGVGNSPEPFYHFLPPGVTWRDVRERREGDP